MSEHTQDSSQQRYNDIAIATAEKLDLIRKTFRRKRATSPPSLEILFPDHNRVPVGIAQEYERMGNRPVSELLAALADDEGAERQSRGASHAHALLVHEPHRGAERGGYFKPGRVLYAFRLRETLQQRHERESAKECARSSRRLSRRRREPRSRGKRLPSLARPRR